ncbi:guanine nucleotide-binding protein subunit alpha [Chytridiales sp. JEL 0842]|nr:guanine nucleotide-binding protein subunit alpha [Chytridiales sp. JEL 0842]
MGNCGSTPAEAEANKKSREIEKQLKADAKADSDSVKLLLLGSGESGKSTVLKQFKLIHGVGFTDAERTGFRPAILGNVIGCAKTLVNAMETLQIPYGFVPPKDAPPLENGAANGTVGAPTAATVDGGRPAITDRFAALATSKYEEIHQNPENLTGPAYQAAAFIKAAPASFGEGEKVPASVVDAIKLLWADPGIQYCFSRSNEYQIIDSCPYYLNDVARFCEPNFVPNDQDILSARVMTTTITETRFKVEGITFRVFDVGGQRSERKKWAPYFEDVTAILFISAISAYDQTCFEDNTTNRIVESLNLFASICNHPLFKSTAMILFLNKIDLFQKKLQTTPIRNYFPSYLGPNAYEEASEYFASRFIALNKYAEKKIYIHFTWATDTKQIRTVLITVNTIIIRLNLQEAGL